MTSPLASPVTLPSGLTLPNRIAKAPMTENLADADNQPTRAHEDLYRRWAEGGAGLLITGNLMIDRRYLERSRNIVADAHLDVRRLARVAAAVGDTPLIAQLSHPGRQCNRYITSEPVAPSATGAVSLVGSFAPPRALTGAEIEGIVRGFGESAARCETAGIDGVQVHAAHGYLLAQFLSPSVNQRDDRWGGDVRGRATALLESVAAVRARTGDGFTVAVKLNSSDFRHGGFTEDDAAQVVGWLAEAGVDLVEISGGTYESPALFGLADGQVDGDGPDTARAVKEGYFVSFARRAREVAPDLPLMLTGGLRTRAAMEHLVAEGTVDVVGLGRPLALEPDLPNQLLAGRAGIELPSYALAGPLSMAGESEWYEHQIARIARGDEPDRSLNPYLAAARFVGGELTRGLSGGPRRRRMASALGR